MYGYIVNGKERTAHEIRIGKHFTIVIYHNVKRRERYMQIVRDKFFGTGTTIYVFSRI